VSDPSPGERREQRLFDRLRGSISLSRAQAIAGLVAAFLSIGGSVYGYLKVTRPPTHGELITVVRDRADATLADAQVEILTPKDALVTSFSAAEPPGARRSLKEGTYRLRVSHPKHATETRMVQVIAGQTSEVRFKLGPRAVATPAAAPAGGAAVPSTDTTRAVSEGVDALRKILKK
jgi:hypothetical protein